MGVCLGESGLRIYRASHGVHGAPKLRKDAVARRIGYAAPVIPNELIEHRSPLGQPPERADLIGTHQTAIALDVGRENRHEPALDISHVGHDPP